MSRVHSASVRLLVPFLLSAIGACALQHHAGSPDVVGHDGTEIVIGDVTDRVDVPILPDGMDAMDTPDASDVMDVTDVPDALDVTDVPLEACSGLVCGSNCVDPNTDVHNCGSCANDCTTLPNVSAGSVRCIAGVCDLNLSCSPGFGNCDSNPANGCEASLMSATNCGACGVMCSGGTPMCGSSSGSYVCVSGCVGTTPDRCGSTCTNRNTDLNNCGACGTVCPSGANSSPVCTAGACSITCATGFADCDGNAANGCEVDTRTNPLSCGTCTTVCPSAANATAACSGSVCGLSCASGFGNCNTNPSDGCEANLNTDPSTCGACGTSCPSPAGATRNCAAGVCGFTCNSGRSDCDGNAANGCESTVATDVNNCGACGNACPAGTGVTPTCTAGVCGVMCASGFVPSGSTCVPAAGEACATAGAVAIADQRTVVLTGNTTGHTSEIRGSCNSVSSSPDLAYAVTPSASGTLAYRLSALFGVAVVVRDGCPGTTELSCDRTNGGVVGGQITVTAGTTYYFWVDGSGGDGTYALELSLDAACGDHQLDGGEGCDDGNTTSSDGCSATCTIEGGARSDACPTGTAAGIALGNGPIWMTGDTTGLANDLRSTCVSMSANDAVYIVTPSVSGVLRATVYPGPVGGGSWDPQVYIRSDCATMTDLACANDNGSRGIESATTMVTAGTRYFVIVDGVSGSVGPFRLSLEIPRCGDGVLQTGETCDDGGTAPGDGCDATCNSESTCRVTESEPNPYNMPDAAPAGCAQSEVFGAITPMNDNDFVSLNLTAGQVLTARTFVGSPTACATGADTILEIFRGPIGAAPPNNTCGSSGALMCNDDIYAGDLCSELSFPVPTSGQYVVRALSYGNMLTLASYGIYLEVR